MGKIAFDVFLDDCLCGVPIKQVLSCQQLIHYRAETEHVCLIAIVKSLENLRRHISRGTTLTHHSIISRSDYGQAEIGDAYVVVRSVLHRAYEDILKFDISMNYLLPLEKVKGKEDLLDNDSRVSLREALHGSGSRVLKHRH